MFTVGFPSIYGDSRNYPNKLSRSGVFFNPVDPPGKATYSRFLNKNGRFKDAHPPILKFHASFDDRGESPRDKMKFRDCYVLYFVEDGTIKVYEPRQRNTGFDQGCIINRNKIPKTEGGHYSLEDFNIGETLILYGKSFKLLDCDAFTKNFMKEMGYRVESPQPTPVDPVRSDRVLVDAHRTTYHKPLPKSHKRNRFLRDFPKCLHFYGIYQRSPSQFEDERNVSVYYSLSDGRLKIIDDKKFQDYQHRLLEGEYDSYLILKPTLVPKILKPTFIGVIGDGPMVLNTAAKTREDNLKDLLMIRQSNDITDRFLLDSNPRENVRRPEDFIRAEDLDLGITINVFGAKLYLYGCDEYTKGYYRHEFEKELVSVPLPEPTRSRFHKLVYPPEFGRPVDSLLSCWSMESLMSLKGFLDLYELSCKLPLKGGRINVLLNFYLNCRDGCDGKMLRFLACILTDDFVKRQCSFMLTFYLEDNTMEITEFNPDFTRELRRGAQYLGRAKVVKPTTNPLNSANCFYMVSDMFVGNVICVKSEKFYIFEADEYTLEYFEKECDRFAYSNINIVMEKFDSLLKEKATTLQSAFEEKDRTNTGLINYHNFRSVICKHLPLDDSLVITEQEIITMARFFAVEEYTGLEFEDLISRAQSEMKRDRFQDFDKLKNQFGLYDINYGNRTGFLTTSQVYEVLISSPVPVKKDLLKFFIFKFPKKDNLVDYQKVIECMDYINNPSKLPDHTPCAINLNWKGVEKVKNREKVDYRLFLRTITSEKI